MKTMKENKGGELECLSVQQPTAHRIVVESPRQSLAKKIRNQKKKAKKPKKTNTRLPLKWPETNYRSCSVKLSSRHLKEFGTAMEIQHSIWLGTSNLAARAR